MRPLFAILLSLTIAGTCEAQVPYALGPPAAAPAAPMMMQPAWGGYAIPDQVPYQPTLDGAGAAPIFCDPSQAWQASPVIPVQPVPIPAGPQASGAAPIGAPADAVYLDGGPPGVP